LGHSEPSDAGNRAVELPYAVAVSAARGVVAEGQITACLIDRDPGKAASWPDDVRQLLTTSREQRV
jgi:acyl-CoA thioesterase FadM